MYNLNSLVVENLNSLEFSRSLSKIALYKNKIFVVGGN